MLSNRVFSTLLLIPMAAVCATTDASLDYQVDGNGFHRSIRYRVDVGELFKENCYVALRLSPDPTLYANVDELADLRRHYGETTACSDGEIDVELFGEKAARQSIAICSPLRNSVDVLSLPIHQRYRLPRENERFVDVTLPRAVLLLGCKERIKEYAVSKLDLCAPCVDLSIKWREIPYKMKSEDFVWTVPIGDLSDISYVTWVTLFAVWFGTFVILGTVWYSKDDKGGKGD